MRLRERWVNRTDVILYRIDGHNIEVCCRELVERVRYGRAALLVSSEITTTACQLNFSQHITYKGVMFYK